MRNGLCAGLMAQVADPRFVFLTGDLGYGALEPLRDALGARFVNAGIAEQNMVSVAAGLAREGLAPWVYSIAPFVYARPFEQIRNDICLHKLPVRLVGNGGGYAYGVMGSTHHALEDYGALLCLPGMRAFVPAFGSDVPTLINQLSDDADGPAYLRLGRCERPAGVVAPAYAPWRLLLNGGGPTLVVVGPLAGSVWSALAGLPDAVRPSVWALSELPVNPDAVPDAFLQSLAQSGHLFVVEEHVAAGGAGQMLAHRLLEMGHAPARFTHHCAQGYLSGTYGSQGFHRAECQLDGASIRATVEAIGLHSSPHQSDLRLPRAA